MEWKIRMPCPEFSPTACATSAPGGFRGAIPNAAQGINSATAAPSSRRLAITSPGRGVRARGRDSSEATAKATLPMKDVTSILSSIEQGDPRAAEQLLPLVYDELRKLAAQRLAREAPGQTLEATALVHEAYLRLVDQKTAPRWDGRGHFFAAAAEAMRRILVENARRKQSEKHGGGVARRDLDLVEPVAVASNDFSDLLALDEALTRFATIDPAKAELVKLRYFAGLTLDDCASMLGISLATAKRSWAYSRAWLFRAIEGRSPGNSYDQ